MAHKVLLSLQVGRAERHARGGAAAGGAAEMGGGRDGSARLCGGDSFWCGDQRQPVTARETRPPHVRRGGEIADYPLPHRRCELRVRSSSCRLGIASSRDYRRGQVLAKPSIEPAAEENNTKAGDDEDDRQGEESCTDAHSHCLVRLCGLHNECYAHYRHTET